MVRLCTKFLSLKYKCAVFSTFKNVENTVDNVILIKLYNFIRIRTKLC